jgi:hypothetical protein
MQGRSLALLSGFQFILISTAIAQTIQPGASPPGGPASPAGTTGGGWAWLWIVFVLILLAAAIWYGTRRRKR